ncbi:MAG: DNA polymerase III subunit gamma/tau [Bacteriovoracaceae bacterium]|nr:DNA polymerase III subunit gamma/tau [Bacteriovoracaceae bacterium]
MSQYQVLARKWRPKRFQDVIGQSHITRTLQNAITHNKIAHAYLFTGTRGVGKTSLARIFAKSLLCEKPQTDGNPCLKCNSCQSFETSVSMDFIEIDGASNNGVENIRDLIDNAQYLPTKGKYKVYVIDEVHMLSLSAFNALLKTLEEPPAHVIFVLATTEPEKLIETVLSRCQKMDFKNVKSLDTEKHIREIAKTENIKFESDYVLKTLIHQANGSMRDALSLLDQVLGLSTNNTVGEEQLLQSLGIAKTSAVREICSKILLGNFKQVNEVYKNVISENIELKVFCQQILDQFYELIQKIDDVKSVYAENLVENGSLRDISVSELFWIYEVLSKDLDWALKSINPSQLIGVLLKKVALRRLILSAQDEKLQHDNVEAKPVVKKDWPGFLAFLNQKSAPIYANLERGNLLEDIALSSTQVAVKVAFAQSSKVFYDYFCEREIEQKMIAFLKEYFERDVLFKVSLLTDNKPDFKSKFEEEKLKHEQLQEQKTQEIRDNSFVKEAESLFNTKVDKIILTNKEG